MYFQESEVIARDHPDLGRLVEQVDGHLASIFASAPLRPSDFGSFIGCDQNQIVSVFELLAEHDVLVSHRMIECHRCHNLMSANDFEDAIEDGDDFECSGCNRPFGRHTPQLTVFRLASETLARPRPAVATADVELSLRDLDQSPNVFRQLGQIWVIKYAGELVLMQDARGMSYLVRLLTEPGRVVPAASLLAAVTGIDPRVTTGSSGKLLDDEAMDRYKRKYEGLQEDLEEARERIDTGRIAEIEAELEAFAVEIARATGLAGRRRENSDAERVRKNVSMAVTRAIDSIRDEHAVLGRHLRNSISPGLTFKYDPEVAPEWLA